MLKGFIRQSSPNINIKFVRMIKEAGCFQSLAKIFILAQHEYASGPIVQVDAQFTHKFNPPSKGL
jgi:hypothetical protein